jgi:hypothetical protein
MNTVVDWYLFVLESVSFRLCIVYQEQVTFYVVRCSYCSLRDWCCGRVVSSDKMETAKNN